MVTHHGYECDNDTGEYHSLSDEHGQPYLEYDAESEGEGWKACGLC